MIPYLVIGRGRLSRHFQQYLTLESIDFEQWDRSSRRPLAPELSRAGAVLLLISDDSIEAFLDRYAGRQSPPLWIHCSGSISTPLAEGAHPLMSFGEELYDLETYRHIPFVCESGRIPFPELFPELSNPHVLLDPGLKPLYHALCTLGGNFTTLLWQKVFAECESSLGIDRSLLFPYLEQITQNLLHSAEPLTGPLVRGDDRTIRNHLQALAGDPFEGVYRAFVAAFKSDSAVRDS